MNKKETGELRRRITYDRNTITALRGCYVSERKEIISCFDCSLALMPEEEADKYLAFLRKIFSGKFGVTAADIAFTTHQVTDSDEHKLLMKLRETGLRDDEAVKDYYERVIKSVSLDGDMLILIAHDVYDIPSKGKDGGSLEDSSRMFSYIMSCVCPVKDTKSILTYNHEDGAFHNGRIDRAASAPELGFMFPAFDDRAANIYGALYYTRDAGENYPSFVEGVFGGSAPMTSLSQRETFQSVLSDAIGEDCSYEVVHNVREQLGELVENYEADKTETDPLTVSKYTMKALLEASGVSEEKVAAFGEKFDEEFGEGTEIVPENIAELKRLELATPDVTIKVNPERGDLVETRVIDGVKYILIRADENVELNGMNLNIV